jgi:hypothetical protein
MGEGARDDRRVAQQVLVAEHDPPGRPRGARGVLQDRQVFACQPGRRPGQLQPFGELVDRDHLGRSKEIAEVASLLHLTQDALAGERQSSLSVGEDGEEPAETPAGARRIDGHRDHSRVEAAEERRDVFRARR